jgi:lysophospholipase L1-like esterase
LRRLLTIGALLAVTALGSYSSAPSATERPITAVGSGVARPVTGPEPLAVFVGDSYTKGTGATSESARWVNLTASAKGWRFVNLGRGGTGYFVTSKTRSCAGAVCPNYAGMIPQVAKEAPDIIVVAGGQNDFSAFNTSRQSVIDAIRATYAKIRSKFPSARIIAVGPSTPRKVNPDVEKFDQVVHDAATFVKAEYVSLLEPNAIRPGMLGQDKVHVNDAGHMAIAERVTAGLR